MAKGWSFVLEWNRTVRLLSSSLIAGVVLAAGATAGAQAEPLRGVNDRPLFSWVGGNATQDLVSQRAVKANGVGSVYRFALDWREVQGDINKPAQWATYDDVFASIEAAGLRPLPVFVSAPRWAWHPLCNTSIRGAVCPPSPLRYSDWGAFVRAGTQRYADPSSEHFADPIAIEIWNEPNKKGAWNTSLGPDPAAFADVFKVGFDAVNSVRPGLPIGVAGLAGVGKDQAFGDKTVPTFLNGFYDRLGTRTLGPDDGIGIHPYPGENEITQFPPTGQFRGILDQAQNVINARDPGRPLWVTEVGYEDERIGRTDQACGVVNVLRKLENLDASPDYKIPFTFVHSITDAVQPGETFGLTKDEPGLPAKPAYCVLAADSGLSPGVCDGLARPTC